MLLANLFHQLLSSKGMDIVQNVQKVIQMVRESWPILSDKRKMFLCFGYIACNHTAFQDPASWYNVAMASVGALTLQDFLKLHGVSSKSYHTQTSVCARSLFQTSDVLILYNNQGNAQVFNLFIYLLLPYTFRDFFKPISRGMCTNSAMVLVSWI
jgi:hypothetical protein